MLTTRVLTFACVGLLGLASGLPADQAKGQQWVAFGQQLYAARDYDKAIQAFTSAAKEDATNAAAWKGLGNSFYAKKDYPNALKYYKYSQQINPSDTALGTFISRLEPMAAGSASPSQASPAMLAARAYQNRQYDLAAQYYQQAVDSNPNDAGSWQGLGNARYALKDKPGAVQAYQRAVALNPSNTSLKNFLATYAPETAGGTQVASAGGGSDWAQPLWRSAILPGWGQAYNGQGTKALVLGGLTLGMLGATAATFMAGDAARMQYMGLKAGADFEAPYSTWESMANLNHLFYIGFGLSYGYTLVDAVLSAKSGHTTTGMLVEPPSVALLPMKDGAGLSYQLQF